MGEGRVSTEIYMINFVQKQGGKAARASTSPLRMKEIPKCLFWSGPPAIARHSARPYTDPLVHSDWAIIDRQNKIHHTELSCPNHSNARNSEQAISTCTFPNSDVHTYTQAEHRGRKRSEGISRARTKKERQTKIAPIASKSESRAPTYIVTIVCCSRC